MKRVTNNSTIFNISKAYSKTKQLFDTVFAIQKGVKIPSLILTGGAVKGGKSFGAIGVFILLANTFPKSRWVIVRKTNKVIQRNLLPVWDKLDYMCNASQSLKKKEGDYYKSFDNGSEIILMAENYAHDKEGNAFRGLDINGYILDEGNELQESTWRVLSVRSGTNRHTCDIQPVNIITCNPTFGWLKKEVYDCIEDGTAPKSWVFYPSNPADNPSNSQEQFELWREQLSSYDYRRFIQGFWGAEKKIGAFLKEFDPNKHLCTIDFDPKLPVHISFDENFLPHITCIVEQVYMKEGEEKRIVQVAEILSRPPKNTASRIGVDICNYLKDNNFESKIYVYGDATSQKNSVLAEQGATFFNQIIDGFADDFHYEKRILKSNPSVQLSGEFLNQHLTGKFGWKFFINENCGYSISDYTDTLEDENGNIKKARVTDSISGLSYEKNGHFVDAKRYFVVSLFNVMYKAFVKKRIT